MPIGSFTMDSNIHMLVRVMATVIRTLTETSMEAATDIMVRIMDRPFKSLKVKRMNFYTTLPLVPK